jgi:hypothetical protein
MYSLIRRKNNRIKIAPRNAELFVQTVHYKTNPHAFRNIVIILLVFAALFVLMAFLNTTAIIIAMAGVVAAGLGFYLFSSRQQSPFVVNYSEPLIFEPEALQVGDEYFSIRDMEDIVFYIHSFYGFRYHTSRLRQKQGLENMLSGGMQSEYGDKNEFQFTALGKRYECRFLLGSGNAWLAIYEIMHAWRLRGKEITVTEEFSYDFIQQEIMLAS